MSPLSLPNSTCRVWIVSTQEAEGLRGSLHVGSERPGPNIGGPQLSPVEEHHRKHVGLLHENSSQKLPERDKGATPLLGKGQGQHVRV